VPLFGFCFFSSGRHHPSWGHCSYDPLHNACIFMSASVLVEITGVECM
jgi:hypothetical protein